MGKLVIVFAALAGSAIAQSPADFEARVRAAMAPSIEKQRASVQKQATTALPVASLPSAGFFTVPWPAPPGFTPLPMMQAACDPLPKEKLDPLVTEAAEREGVQTDLIHAVIEQESAAKPCAISAKGAQGLMQLMPSVQSDFGVKDPFDAKQNIDAGTRLLKQLLAKYNGDTSLALSAYNAGSARVDSAGGIPPIAETINYVNDIINKVTPAQPPQQAPAETEKKPPSSSQQ